MVLVDTSIWSLFLRRDAARLNSLEGQWRREFENLVASHSVAIIGAVRQELLTGIREIAQFQRLKSILRAYPDADLETADYELAADSSNRCQSAGIAGHPIDFLICAASVRRNWMIFTADKDFEQYQQVLPINLFKVLPA